MRTLLLTTGSAWLSRLLLAGAQVYTIPILMRTLNAEEYAAHVLLAALAPWFLLADLGLGAALQNYVAKFLRTVPFAHDLTNRWLTQAAAVCALVFTLVAATSQLTGPLLFGTFEQLPTRIQPTLLCLAALLYICGTLGNVAYKVWYAIGLGLRANAATGLAGIVTLASVHALDQFDPEARLYAAMCITVGPQAVIGILAFCLCRFRPRFAVDSAPSAGSQASKFHDRLLWRTALSFFGFNLMAAMVLNVDYLLIARLMTPEDIVIYGLVTRIFGLFWMLYSTALQALWPVCTRLLHAKENRAASSAIKRILGAGFVGLIVFVACCSMGIDLIFDALTNREVSAPPVSLLIAFAIYYAARIWTDTFAMVLLSQDRLRALYRSTPVQVLLSIGLQIVLIPLFGLEGALLALLISYLLTVSWVLPRHARALLREST